MKNSNSHTFRKNPFLFKLDCSKGKSIGFGSKLRFGCVFFALFGFAGAFLGLTHPDPISSSELDIEDLVFVAYFSSPDDPEVEFIMLAI